MASAPSPPDPYKTADAQTQANNASAAYNASIGNANTTNPYGSQINTIAGYNNIYNDKGKVTGRAPQWQQTTTLSPEQQKLYELETQAKTNFGQTAVNQSNYIRDTLSKPFTTEGMQAWATPNAPGDVRQDNEPTDRAAIEAAIMGRYNSDAERTNAAQGAQLAAKGLSPGTAAYGTVDEAQHRARTDAVQQAYLASGSESRAAQDAYNKATQQKYDMGNSFAAFLNNLRQGQVSEGLTLRNQPLNEASALMSGGQVTVPQFQGWNAPSTSPANIAGLIMDNYNIKAQNAANTNSGIFGLAGNALKLATAVPTGGLSMLL